MRAIVPLVLIGSASACSAPAVNAPSLSPRAAEAIDPRVPVPDPMLPTNADPGLVRELDSLVARARAGDAAFTPLAAQAERLASAAGAAESESWVVAQQALSAAIAARAPVAGASADIDALGAARVKALGGIGAADLKAIQAAGAQVAAIDSREAERLSAIQARLSR